MLKTREARRNQETKFLVSRAAICKGANCRCTETADTESFLLSKLINYADGRLRQARSFLHATAKRHSSGQSAVEFTLIFLLFLVIVWIPADFGLAFYTAQLAQNASREAARIAAADPNLAAASCTMPCASAPDGTALKAAADRMSQALLPGATISLTLDPASPTNCNRMAQVFISGDYNFFFYRLLQGIGIPISKNSINIQRRTTMRWEHQAGCMS